MIFCHMCGAEAQDAFDQDRKGYDPWVYDDVDWAYCMACDAWTEVLADPRPLRTPEKPENPCPGEKTKPEELDGVDDRARSR